MSHWREVEATNGTMIMGGAGGTTVFIGPNGVIVWPGGPDTYHPNPEFAGRIEESVAQVRVALGEFDHLVREALAVAEKER